MTQSRRAVSGTFFGASVTFVFGDELTRLKPVDELAVLPVDGVSLILRQILPYFLFQLALGLAFAFGRSRLLYFSRLLFDISAETGDRSAGSFLRYRPDVYVQTFESAGVFSLEICPCRLC